MFGLRVNRRAFSALLLGAFAASGLVGCGETATESTKIEQKGPGGTTTEQVTGTVKQSGENPPPPTGATGVPAPK
jgi:hypothetical protein